MLVKLPLCLQRMQTMAIIFGFLMPETFEHAMKYMNRILVQSLKLKSLSTVELEVLHRLHKHITENRKLKLYASCKKVYKFESYFDYIQDFTVGCSLAKLRVSAHNLQIEAGRFSKNKTPRDERFCPYCKSLKIFSVEDEIHFLLTCHLYSEKRQRFSENIHRHFPSTASLNDINMDIWLMSAEDYNITKRLGNFCKKSLEERSKFLRDPSSI